MYHTWIIHEDIKQNDTKKVTNKKQEQRSISKMQNEKKEKWMLLIL